MRFFSSFSAFSTFNYNVPPRTGYTCDATLLTDISTNDPSSPIIKWRTSFNGMPFTSHLHKRFITNNLFTSKASACACQLQ